MQEQLIHIKGFFHHYDYSLRAWLVTALVLFVHFYINRKRALWLDCIVIFVSSFLLIAPADYTFGNDDEAYVFAAKNLLAGYGATDVSGTHSLDRIGYVALYVVAYALGGIVGAALVAPLGFALFCVVAFCFGERFYGSAVAAAGVILLILLPRENEPNIDSWVGFLAISMFLLYLLPPGRIELPIALAATGVFALAYLMKITALPCLGFPLLLLLFRADRRLDRRFLVGLLASFLVVSVIALLERHFASPPAAYFNVAEGAAVAGYDNPEGLLGSSVKNVVAYFLWPGHSSSLLLFAPFLVLFPVALGVACYLAARGSYGDKVVLAAMAIWLPVIALVGQRDWRPEHALVFVALSFLLVARLVFLAAQRTPWPRALFAVLAAAMAVSLFAASTQPSYPELYPSSVIGHAMTHRPLRLRAEFRGSPELAEFGSSVKTDARIWSSPILLGVSASLLSENHFWIAPLPAHALIKPDEASGYLHFVKGWTDRVTGPIWGIYALRDPGSPLFILYRQDLEDGFRSVPFVLFSFGQWPWVPPLTNMLVERMLAKEQELRGTYFTTSVFAWDEQAYGKNIDRQFIDRNALMALKRMRSDDPSLYRWYADQLRAGDIVFDPAEFDGRIDGDAAENPVFVLPGG